MSDQAALRRALESALADDFDDLAAHRAYADLLTEMGDPRGELAAVQLALEDPSRPAPEQATLRAREKALLEEHLPEWLGGLADLFAPPQSEEERFLRERIGPHHAYRFTRGWLAALRLGHFSSRLAEALAALPAARLLAKLRLDHSPEENDPGYATLTRAPFLDGLRRFQLGQEGNCHTHGERVEIALAAMRRLEELRLYADYVDLEAVFALPMPSLRLLHVYQVGDEYPLEVLADNPSLTNLEELNLRPRSLDYGDEAYIRPGPFRELCFSPHLARLSRLSVRLSEVGDDGVAALVESGLLGRLRSLDLDHGTVTDEGAWALASSPDIRHLEYLRLTFNQLTPAGVAALRGRVPQLEIDEQYDPRALEHGWHLIDDQD